MVASAKPIVVVGTGRSGSSALYRLMARHPDLAWLSGLCNRYPRRPELNRYFMRVMSVRPLENLLRRRFQPNESYVFWEHYARGFGRPFRDLTAADVTERERKAIRRALGSCVTESRSRLLLKITGWPRIGYLSEIFPDAKYIHLVRDGRAVANSLLSVPFWDGWRGPSRWRWDALSGEQHSAWERTGRSFVALAGFEWVMMMAAVEKASATLSGDRFLEIRYEDFCDDPAATLRRVTEFAELEWTPDFEKRVARFPAGSRNFKWQSDLTPAQQQTLQAIQAPYLAKYGYSS